MSRGDDNVTGMLEKASEVAYRQEASRRMSLTNLGLMPLISRFDPVGAMSANRFASPTLHMRSEASTTDEGMIAERKGPGPASGEMSAGTKALERERNQGANQENNALIKAEGEMQGDQLRALLRDDGGEHSSSMNAAVDSARGTPLDAVHKRAEERLCLLFVITEDVLWIEQLDDHLLRKDQLHLIAAMARAIRGSSVSCEHQQFDWPPAGGLKLSQDNGMEHMLSGYLQRLVADHQSQVMILMGAVDVLPALSLSVHRIPSSLTMLQEPATKRDAWSVLKSLVVSG